MNPKRLLVFAILLPISFLSGEKPNGRSAYEAERQRAIAINELAGKIHSPDDARKLVDMVVAEFSDALPSKWVSREIRGRIAQAEYESATNPSMLIPEQRVADAWNRFVREIGAPHDTEVTAAEVHYLRDGNYVSGRFFWSRGNQTIWGAPNVYAVGRDGKVADGCRALEAIRVTHDLAYLAEDISWARERERKGILFSDELDLDAKTPHRTESRFEVRAGPRNLVLEASNRYVKERGAAAVRHAVENLLDGLFPE